MLKCLESMGVQKPTINASHAFMQKSQKSLFFAIFFKFQKTETASHAALSQDCTWQISAHSVHTSRNGHFPTENAIFSLSGV